MAKSKASKPQVQSISSEDQDARKKALEAAMSQIEKQFGKGSVTFVRKMLSARAAGATGSRSCPGAGMPNGARSEDAGSIRTWQAVMNVNLQTAAKGFMPIRSKPGLLRSLPAGMVSRLCWIVLKGTKRPVSSIIAKGSWGIMMNLTIWKN